MNLSHTPPAKEQCGDFLSFCRLCECQRVSVAPRIEHLPWWECVAAVHCGVKLQLRVELRMDHTQWLPFPDPKLQTPTLSWLLLHHCGDTDGWRKLSLPSRAKGGEHHHCGDPQPAFCPQSFRWETAASFAENIRVQTYIQTFKQNLREGFIWLISLWSCLTLTDHYSEELPS